MPVIHFNDPLKTIADVYIGRPRGGGLGEWGNPFTHLGKLAGRKDMVLVANRDEAVESYRRQLWQRIQSREPGLMERLAALNGKTLVCWCVPHRCHGHVLEAAAAWAAEQLDQTGASDCPNCGASPCYHICPNSPAYYSAEQERYDDAFYGMDDVRERYAAEIADMRHEALMD